MRVSISDLLAHLGKAEFHAGVFGDDPLGIRQRSDGEHVGQEEQTSGNHRQLIHDNWFGQRR